MTEKGKIDTKKWHFRG